MAPTTQLDNTQSTALRLATLLATLTVVLRHSFNLHLYYVGGHPWMDAVDWNVIWQRTMVGVTGIAIPAFFLMSGFLFFRNLENWNDLKKKIRKRFRTLLLPYLLWNTAFLVLWGLLIHIPFLREQIIHSFSWEWKLSFFLHRVADIPMVGQFWYIRTLMIFLLFSPIIMQILKNVYLCWCVLLVLCCRWIPVDTSLLSTEGMLFFFAGCYLVRYHGLPQKWHLGHCLWLLLPMIYDFVLCLFFSSFPVSYLGIPCGLLFGWQVCLHLTEYTNIREWALKMNAHSFFIYALHGSILSGSAVVIARHIAHSPVHSFLAYWTCFLFTVCLSLIVSCGAKKFFPVCYALFSGDR